MKKKIVGSFLAVSCILPISVMASDIQIEQEEIVGGSVILNFNSNGGTECTSLTLPVASTPITYELPIPMKAGHIFKGWFTKDDIEVTGENPFNAFSSVVSGESATLMAKWEKQEAITKTSSFSIEEIENSEEYYELIQSTENFADGSKIVVNTKTRKIENYIIEENITYTYYNQDGSTTGEAMSTYHGYEEYKRAHAINDLSVTVLDVNGNPVEGLEINFKTTEEDINLKSDKDGKIVHTFKPGTYESTVITVPNGYALNQPVEKLGLGKMYSISYIENYVLDIVDIGEPPKQEESKENLVIVEEEKEEITEENKNTSIVITETKEETNKTITTNVNKPNNTSSSSVTANIKEDDKNKNQVEKNENPDPDNKEIVKAPQTDDTTSFLFLGLIPISLGFMFKKKKK